MIGENAAVSFSSVLAYLRAAPPRAVRPYALVAAAGPVLAGLLIAVAVVVLRADLPDPIRTGYGRSTPRQPGAESGPAAYAVFFLLFGAALSGFAWVTVANIRSVVETASDRAVVASAAFLAWFVGGTLARDVAVDLTVNIGGTDAVPGLLLAAFGWPVSLTCGLLAALLVWVGAGRRHGVVEGKPARGDGQVG